MTAAQELVENQHADQFHLDELTGVKTPIREFLASEVERVKGIAEEGESLIEDRLAAARAEGEHLAEQAKADAQKLVDAAKADAEKVKADAEAEVAQLKAELEALKAPADRPAGKTAKTTKAADAKPAATAVRETGDIK